jgi:hypothetical protein
MPRTSGRWREESEERRGDEEMRGRERERVVGEMKVGSRDEE